MIQRINCTGVALAHVIQKQTRQTIKRTQSKKSDSTNVIAHLKMWISMNGWIHVIAHKVFLDLPRIIIMARASKLLFSRLLLLLCSDFRRFWRASSLIMARSQSGFCMESRDSFSLSWKKNTWLWEYIFCSKFDITCALFSYLQID